MTLTIPRWCLYVAALVLIGGGLLGAYLLGRGTSSPPPEPASASSPADNTDPGCTDHDAKLAILNSLVADRLLSKDIVGGPALFGQYGFTVMRAQCADLTGDGQDEFLVQLACCTSGAPSPLAIFSAREGQWDLAFSRLGVASSAKVSGQDVIEQSGTYLPSDPLCCPTGVRKSRIYWNGSEFAVEALGVSPNRLVAVGASGAQTLGDLDLQTASLSDAIRVFGPPSHYSSDQTSCPAIWIDLGISITFANFGGGDSCFDGSVGSVEIGGHLAEEAQQAGWYSSQGVRIGTSEQELNDIYPRAALNSEGGSDLIRVRTPFGLIPALSAMVSQQRVNRLDVFVGAAGE